MAALIIAEAGVNHNGSLETALKMVDIAKECGADAIKFQSFTAEAIVSVNAPKADYQKKHTLEQESQLEMIRSLELQSQDYQTLINHCSEKNIEFLSSPFDIKSIELLVNLGVHRIKIPSGEITNLPYLRKISESKIPVLLSTGMAKLGEVESAIDVLLSKELTRSDITILHCNTEYPTPFKDVNLKAMPVMGAAFDMAYGYSDHTLGSDVAIAAVALGATVIEKHFTLDNEMTGPDHKASVMPDELTKLVKSIRNVEISFGSSIKRPSKSEFKNIVVVRKSLVASKSIKKGEIFSIDNITTKRPGSGISPMSWDSVIGKLANRNFDKDELIEL